MLHTIGTVNRETVQTRLYGFADEWLHQAVGDDHLEWQGRVRAAVMRCELVQWRRGARTKVKLEHYIKWKHDVAWECYLDNADEQARRRMTKARAGIWELRIETGRWESVSAGGASMRTPRHLRWCQQCYLETEDLEHLLLSCPGYVKVRKEFFGRCVRDLRVPPTARALAVALAATCKGSCLRAAATSTPAETLLEWLMAGRGSEHAMRYLTELWHRRKFLRYDEDN